MYTETLGMPATLKPTRDATAEEEARIEVTKANEEASNACLIKQDMQRFFDTVKG